MALQINAGLRAALLANATIAAAVGERVFLRLAPFKTNPDGPWIVLQKISNERESAHDGDQSLGRSRWQINVSGTDQDQVDAVRDEIVRSFNAVTYTYNAGTVEAPENHELTFFHADDGDNFEEDTRIWEANVDLFIWTT